MKFLVVIFLVSVGLVGCNTMEGFGKDVKHAGKSIEKAAK